MNAARPGNDGDRDDLEPVATGRGAPCLEGLAPSRGTCGGGYVGAMWESKAFFGATVLCKD